MATVLKADAEQLWRGVPRPGDVLDLGVSLRQALGLQRQIPATRPVIGRREAWLLGAFALSLHLGVLAWLAQREPAPLQLNAASAGPGSGRMERLNPVARPSRADVKEMQEGVIKDMLDKPLAFARFR